MALVVVGAVPASASTVLNLRTEHGGVAPLGAPARIFLSIEPEVGEYCTAHITGSIAVNGKPKDKMTFPGELAGACGEIGEREGAITGTVSVLEDTLRTELVLRSNIKYTGDPPCVYQLPSHLEAPFAGEVFTDRFHEVPGVNLRRVSGPRLQCPSDFAYVEFFLSDPQSREIYEDEAVHVGRSR
jgi:hypothetical protein